MDREINLDAILALDAEIIRLKRTLNSLLSIARIPPEILGHIFHFSVTEVGDPHFTGIPKGAYNFLLVCHRWFQVALRTPGLRSSWGNNLRDWKRWYLHSGISALDLILDGRGYQGAVFDGALRDALMDRAARDVIRKVHLKGDDKKLLAAIVSSLIHKGGGVRPSSIESIVLSDVDVSSLFTRHRFPKLRNLRLSGNFKISSWDHLKSTTTALTSLSLDLNDIDPSSAVPATSQILSLLASNPNLRFLVLDVLPINDDGGDGPGLQVPLHHLEHILLTGTLYHGLPILRRLEFPERMDHEEITLHNCTEQGILEVIGPRIQNYLRHHTRFRDRLGIFVWSDLYRITFCARVVGVGYRGPNRLPRDDPPYGRFEAKLSQLIPRDARKKLCIDILALLSQESIVDFETNLLVTEEVVVAMPNLKALYLVSPVVSDGFLLPGTNGPDAHKKLLPSLQRLYLKDVKAVYDNWEPLVTYLTCQTFGGQGASLNVFGEGVHICPEVIERIEGLVEELIYIPDPCKKCPFSNCP